MTTGADSTNELATSGATGAVWETAFAVFCVVGFEPLALVAALTDLAALVVLFAVTDFVDLLVVCVAGLVLDFLLDSTVVLLLVVLVLAVAAAAAVTACAFNVGMTNRAPYIKALVRADRALR